MPTDAVDRAGEASTLSGALPDTTRQPDHLLVLSNGLWGSTKDWSQLLLLLAGHLPGSWLVHVSTVNQGARSHDGIDVCGHRLAAEIRHLVADRPGLRFLSLVGHSMGGLLARFAAGVLHDPATGLMAGLRPAHLITIATPHAGCGTRGVAMLPFLAPLLDSRLVPASWHDALHRNAAALGTRLFGRTVQHLMLGDGPSGGGGGGGFGGSVGKPTPQSHAPGLPGGPAPHRRCGGHDGLLGSRGGVAAAAAVTVPLLVAMTADWPGRGLHFMAALRSFQTRTCYANAGGDHLVGHANAALRCSHAAAAPRPRLPSLRRRLHHCTLLADPLCTAGWPPHLQPHIQQLPSGTGSAAAVPPHAPPVDPPPPPGLATDSCGASSLHAAATAAKLPPPAINGSSEALAPRLATRTGQTLGDGAERGMPTVVASCVAWCDTEDAAASDCQSTSSTPLQQPQQHQLHAKDTQADSPSRAPANQTGGGASAAAAPPSPSQPPPRLPPPISVECSPSTRAAGSPAHPAETTSQSTDCSPDGPPPTRQPPHPPRSPGGGRTRLAGAPAPLHAADLAGCVEKRKVYAVTPVHPRQAADPGARLCSHRTPAAAAPPHGRTPAHTHACGCAGATGADPSAPPPPPSTPSPHPPPCCGSPRESPVCAACLADAMRVEEEGKDEEGGVALLREGHGSERGSRAVTSLVLRRLGAEVPWRRVDVWFGPCVLGGSHNNIQYNGRINFVGRPVILHVAEQLLAMQGVLDLSAAAAQPGGNN